MTKRGPPSSGDKDDTRLLAASPARLRRKARLLFALILLLGAVLTVLVYRQSADVMDVTMALIDKDVPILKAIADLKVAVVAQEPILYEYYATEDRGKFQRAFAENQARIGAGLAQVWKVFAERPEPAIIGTERQALLGYAERLDATLSLPDTDWDLAREMLAEISKRSTTINTNLDQLVALLQADVTGRGHHTHALVDRTVLLVLAFSLGMVALSLVVGYYVNASLVAAWHRRRLATFPERNPNPIVTLSLAGEVLYTNPSAVEMTGRLGGQRDARLALFPPDLDARLQHMKDAGEDSGHWEYEKGERILGCGIYLLRDLELFHAYIFDITARKQAERQLHHAAYHDALTGLPNRRRFMEDLALEFSASASPCGAVLLINLDRFRGVIEGLGHGVGDEVLRSVAVRIDEAVRQSPDLCEAMAAYRFEGDVFAVLMRHLPSQSPRRAIALGSRILRVFEAPLPAHEREFFLTASVGMAQYPEDAADAVNALKNADSAVQQLKREGGGGVLRYSTDLAVAATERLELEHALRRAVERQELYLLYQPQLDIASGRIVGAEALVRWRHPVRGQVSPAKFIPLAEETGLVVEIGEWVLRAACDQGRRWREAGMDLVIGVNVSARQLLDAAFPQVVSGILAASGLAPSRLEIEITETAAMRDVDLTVRVLTALKATGVRVAIDDFGTGYSSLNYLKRFSLDELKIDQSFVRHMTEDRDDAAIVQAIVDLAHRLQLRVIAEGVETEAHLLALRDYGCEQAQGYLIARPLPTDELESLLASPPRQ